jgi:hypothetical protein
MPQFFKLSRCYLFFFAFLSTCCAHASTAFFERFPSNGLGIALTGGFLEWMAKRDDPSTSSWDSGFRIELDYRYPTNAWGIEALYTQFRSSGVWQLKYNTYDLSWIWLRFLNHNFALQPYFGLRGLFLKQRLPLHHPKHTRSAGPLLGVNLEFSLWKEIALFSSFWASTLFGNQDEKSLSAQAGFKGIFPLYLRESILSCTLCYEYTHWIHLNALTLQGITLAIRGDF